MRSQVLSEAKDPLRKSAAGPSPLARLRTCAAIATALVAQSASACPVCFGGTSGGGQGMNAAIFFLLAIVGLVQVGFIALFWSFWRRAKALRRRRESFQVLHGGAR